MNWVGDGWVQALVQTGALGLVALIVRGMFSSHERAMDRTLGAFQKELQLERDNHGKRTEQLIHAIDQQTLSFRLDIQQLHAAITAGSCKAAHNGTPESAREAQKS